MQKVDAQLFFVAPMECKEVRDVALLPRGDDWQYELKFDGYRCIAIKQSGEAQLFSRRGLQFSQFLNLNRALVAQPPRSFIIDGEVVALGPDGRSDFNGLQHARTKQIEAHFYAFDLLNLDGIDLKTQPLEKRQKMLRENFAASAFFHAPAPLTGRLKIILQKIKQFGFEGIVAKKRDSVYVTNGRPGTWVKKKIKQADEFIVGGYIPNGNAVDELIVGKFLGRKLMFVAAVDGGFVPATRRQVFEQISVLESKNCPFANLPENRSRRSAMDREKMSKARWVKPRAVVEIAFNEWTPDKHLRHSEFKRLRDDKGASEVSAFPA